MKDEVSLFPSKFLQRFSNRRLFIMLSMALIGGVTASSVMISALQLFDLNSTAPMFFSGIPIPGTGLASCFSSILLNLLSCLIILFLLGVTAFGAVGIPVFLLIRGASIAMGALWFLMSGGGLSQSALCFLPSVAGSSLLLLLFSTRALAFSNSLALAGFTQRQESLNFRFYFKDFLIFICFGVLIALASSLLAKLYLVFI